MTERSVMACRGCGSTKTRAELDAIGAVNCCPERAMNEVIEQRHGIPALTPGGIDPIPSTYAGDLGKPGHGNAFGSSHKENLI